MLLAVRVRVSGEPLRIVSKAKVDLLRLKAQIKVRLDSVERSLNASVMSGDIVTAVHQIVGHDVDHVDRLEDLGTLLLGKGDHVASAAGDGDREGLITDSLPDGCEELGVGLDLVDFGGVGDLLVVLAVTAGVLPVDV